MSEYSDDNERSERSDRFRPRRFIKGPDRTARDASIKELDDEIKQVSTEIDKVSKEIEVTVTPKDVQSKRKELSEELNGIINKQRDLKRQRQAVNDQIKALDMSMKSKIAKIEETRGKHKYRSTKEIDSRIEGLEERLNEGTLKIVEERRYVKEISALRRLKKDYAGVEGEQKLVDDDKAKIKELRKQLAELSNKELQEGFERVTGGLDELKVSTGGIKEQRDKLFGKRRELHAQRDALYDKKRAVRAAYDDKYKAFKAELEKEKVRREDERKQEEEDKKKEDIKLQIEQLEEEAKQPANRKEIEQVETLLDFFGGSKENKEEGDAKAADFSDVKLPPNAVLISKKPENFFGATANKKKGKKHRKKKAGKFVLEPTIISELSALGVSLPTSTADSDTTVEQLQNKLKTLKETQADVTKQNAEQAKQKIADLKKQLE